MLAGKEKVGLVYRQEYVVGLLQIVIQGGAGTLWHAHEKKVRPGMLRGRPAPGHTRLPIAADFPCQDWATSTIFQTFSLKKTCRWGPSLAGANLGVQQLAGPVQRYAVLFDHAAGDLVCLLRRGAGCGGQVSGV